MRVMSRPTPRLKRALGPALLAVLVVGDVLGAGIYILIGEVAGEVGGLVWLAFAVAFVVAMLSALSYTELVAAHPHAAGSAHYARLAFDKPLVTYIMGFVVTCSAVTTCAAVSRAVGGQYLSEFVEWPVAAVAVGTIMVLALITWIGIAESARLNAVMTVVEVSGLVLVLAAGVMAFVDGSAEPARLTDVGGTDPGALGILAAAALAFFAFLGFEDVVHLSEEVKDPRRTFPRAMLIGMTVVALLYLGVAVAAAVLVEPSVLAGSDAPLLDALAASPIPVSPKAFAVVAMIAVTNTALLALVTASRQIYGLAEDGDLPRVLRRYRTAPDADARHHRRRSAGRGAGRHRRGAGSRRDDGGAATGGVRQRERDGPAAAPVTGHRTAAGVVPHTDVGAGGRFDQRGRAARQRARRRRRRSVRPHRGAAGGRRRHLCPRTMDRVPRVNSLVLSRSRSSAAGRSPRPFRR